MPTRTLLTAALIAAFSSPLLAQTAPRPDAGQILRDQKLPAPSTPSLAPEIRIERPTPGSTAPADGPAFFLRSIKLLGLDAGEETLVSDLLQAASGKDSSLAELQALAQQIAERYRKAGWVLAATWLPPQTIQNGEAQIRIQKGHLSGSDLRGHDHPGARLLLSALPTDVPLENAALERTLLLIEEQPGVGATRIEFLPGTGEGNSQLRLTLPDPGPGRSHRLSLDNHGGYYSGQTRLGLRSRLENPFHLSDRIDFALIGSENNTWSGQLDWSALIASNGLRAGLRLASVRYELGETYKVLDAHGTANTLGASLVAPIFRRFGAAIDAGLEYEHRWLTDRNRLEGEARKEVDNVILSVAGQVRDAGGVSALNFTQGFGQLDIKNDVIRRIDAASTQSNGSYQKTSLTLQRWQDFIGNSQLVGRIQGQWASRNLDSSEKLSLGGANGIRAYPQGEISGDEGYLARLDWRMPMSTSCTAGIGYDAGRIRINKNRLNLITSNHESRRGWALFAEGRYKDFDLSATIAWRDTDDKARSGPEKSPRLWVQAGWGF